MVKVFPKKRSDGNHALMTCAGPAKQQWAGIAGFDQRWASDVRECRDLISNGRSNFEMILDYAFLGTPGGSEITPILCRKEADHFRTFYEEIEDMAPAGVSLAEACQRPWCW